MHWDYERRRDSCAVALVGALDNRGCEAKSVGQMVQIAFVEPAAVALLL